VARFDLPGVAAPAAVTAGAALGDPRQQAFQRALQTMLGAKVPVQVLARLADGSSLVEVAGLPARMQLPASALPGTELPLTVTSAYPRPTFQLAEGDAGAPRLLYASADPKSNMSSATIAAAATPPASAPSAMADAAPPGVTSELSPAARLLGAALAQAGGAPVVHATAPLLPGQAVAARDLAPALRQALDTSGLFYESHVAEWAGGARSLDTLGAEPQMRHPPADQAAAANYLAPQLALQEHQQLVWQGQLTPGLPLEWRIGRDAPPRDQDAGPDTPEPAWQSGLRLRFAHLGELEARLVLRGETLSVSLTAGDGATSLLRTHAPRLAEALAAAGIPLAGFAVATGTDADD